MNIQKQKFGVYIGTPLYSSEVHLAYLDSIVLLAKKLEKEGIPCLRQHVLNSSLITKARNICISAFMNDTNLDYFLFIDADIGFEASDVIKLMNHNKSLIAGVYPKKHLRWEDIQNCFFNHDPKSNKEIFEKTSQYAVIYNKEKNMIIKDELIEVDRVGAGFMMIKRDLIKKLANKYPELIYNAGRGEKGYGFFESAIINKEHVSEDYAFCERVKSIGEKIYIDPSIKLTHNGGNLTYYGDYKKHLQYINKK